MRSYEAKPPQPRAIVALHVRPRVNLIVARADRAIDTRALRNDKAAALRVTGRISPSETRVLLSPPSELFDVSTR